METLDGRLGQKRTFEVQAPMSAKGQKRRSAAFSASSRLLDFNGEARIATTKHKSATIASI
jgi:hypothetical protein